MGARGPLSELKLPPDLRVVDGAEAEAPEKATAAMAIKPLAPDKPEKLPPEVSAAWDSIVPELEAAGLLARCDGPTIELALRHFVIARHASEQLLGRKTVTIRDQKNNRTAKHPASQVMRDHSTAFLEYAKTLGLSFVARARTPMKGADDDGEDNPFASSGS